VAFSHPLESVANGAIGKGLEEGTTEGGGNVGRGGRVDRGGRSGSSGGEWMLVRRDRNEQSDSRGHSHGRGRSEDYSDRPSRSDKYQSRISAPAPTQESAPVSVAAPAPVPDQKEVDNVTATPRAAPTKRGPRQSKPTA
jgi:hypothetical protein